ncbi:TIGR02646 family protein [Cyanobium sp. FGCU-6]|nr:TIGR02646 family protein [Cyanobium sp. FGCU6]
MKRVAKSDEPQELLAYRQAHPLSAWEGMRNDALSGGMQAYDAIVDSLEADQGGICAYCEIKISRSDNTTRVEHFIPKALPDPGMNWALNWDNLLATCMGGSQRRNDPRHFLEPPIENLSCDAHKERALGTINCHGVLLNPLFLPAMPFPMRLEHGTGHWHVHEANANTISMPGNTYETVGELVNESIRILNLNCTRLARNRLAILHHLEREIQQARKAGLDKSVFMINLCRRYLGPRYREFFSVYRFRLGDFAEEYLQSIGYNG